MSKGFGGMGNMGDLMKNAQKMQKNMSRVQEELKTRIVEGDAGGGMVKVQVNGGQEVVAVKIDPSVVDPEDVEMLEDLVIAAVREGMRKAHDLSQKEMGKLTGGLNIPGLF